jgi:hypothetical protein
MFEWAHPYGAAGINKPSLFLVKDEGDALAQNTEYN